MARRPRRVGSYEACGKRSIRRVLPGPDGKWVLYWSADSLYRFRSKVVRRVQIVSSSSSSSNIRVGGESISPDGQWVAYRHGAVVPKTVERVAFIPAAGGTPLETFPCRGDALGLEWAPDGKGLQYLLTRQGVTNGWEQNRSGGDPRPVTGFHQGQIYDFAWRRDGHTLLIAKGETTEDVVMIHDAQQSAPKIQR
jgi:Tol biopolymer transport system component